MRWKKKKTIRDKKKKLFPSQYLDSCYCADSHFMIPICIPIISSFVHCISHTVCPFSSILHIRSGIVHLNPEMWLLLRYTSSSMIYGITNSKSFGNNLLAIIFKELEEAVFFKEQVWWNVGTTNLTHPLIITTNLVAWTQRVILKTLKIVRAAYLLDAEHLNG